jgi:HK97 gp10 family phage protein
MKSSVRVVFNKFPEMADRLPPGAADVVRKTAMDIEGRAKAIVAVDTGALKGSIGSKQEVNMATRIEWVVAPHTDYAIYVEYGTGRRGDPAVPHTDAIMGMAPRPYMTPAAEAMREPFYQAMRALLRRL